MVRSMTGFGRASLEEEGNSFTVEIKSVNHRYLDLSVKMPRVLISLEERIRKILSERLGRGKVDIFVTQTNYDREETVAFFNKTVADSYAACLGEIKNSYDVRDDISVSLIARFPEVITLQKKEEDIEKTWLLLKKPIENAVELLIEMREKEGKKLQEDIIKRCETIKEMTDKVALRAPLVVSSYKEKLEQRISEYFKDSRLDENRLAMEVAIFADKSNIDEEIVRLNSHISQVRETLSLTEAVGRKLDFIIQEMNREANTIGSKASDLELINLVLNIKNEIEKVREQVQNIE